VAFEDLDCGPVDVDGIDGWPARPDVQERLAGERVDGAACLAGRDVQGRDRDVQVRAEAGMTGRARFRAPFQLTQRSLMPRMKTWSPEETQNWGVCA
jgi:hypothetical protein